MAASQFFIAETDGWLVSHRANSALPGYLIIASKRSANDLFDLPDDALHEIGPLLALSQAALKQKLGAPRVYIGRYGHISGHAFHFHIIPIYDWVERLFWHDARYRVLGQFAEGEGGDRNGRRGTDPFRLARILRMPAAASDRGTDRSRGYRAPAQGDASPSAGRLKDVIGRQFA